MIIIIGCPTHSFSGSQAVWWSRQGCGCPWTGVQSLWTAHLPRWQSSGCQLTLGLCCRRNGFRHQRHYQINDIIWRAIKWAQIPAAKEPVSFLQQDGKRPDGTTLLPWAWGKPMAWNVTVPDIYAESHIDQTAREACLAANKAAANKIAKYGALSASRIFFPVAVETASTWNQSAIDLIQESQ